MTSTQAPYHKAQVGPYEPTQPYNLRGLHSVPSQVYPRHSLLACQFEPPLEGDLQVVDRFMLAEVVAPPAAVFVVRNLLREPPSAYVCSFNPAEIERVQSRCRNNLTRIDVVVPTPQPRPELSLLDRARLAVPQPTAAPSAPPPPPMLPSELHSQGALT